MGSEMCIRDRLIGDDVELIWEKFKAINFRAAFACIPQRRSIKKVFGVILSNEVRVAFRRRKRVIRALKRSSSTIAEDLRSHADQQLNRAISDARREFERKVVFDCGNNPKKFWGHVRSSLGNKPKVSSVLNSEGVLTDSDVATANALNDFFASVFTREVDVPLPALEAHSIFQCNDLYI